MLEFIFGRAATGKTTTVLNRIENDINNGCDEAFLLVPEQYTFETEKQILTRFGAGFMGKIQVVSFSRLCDIAGRKYGGVSGIRVTDAERRILLSRAIKNLNSRLSLFGKYVGSAGFVQEATDLISELKQAGISALDLSATLNKIEGSDSFCEKINEISLILSEYDALIKGVYQDPLDDLEILYKKACENLFFKDKIIYIDAFKGFTGMQIKLLKLMILQSERLIITFSCEETGSDAVSSEIFTNIRSTAMLLSDYARQNNVKIALPTVLKKSRYNSKSLIRLESLLAEKKTGSYGDEICEDEFKGVHWGRFNSVREEVDCVFRTIHKLVRTKGCTYNDSVVIARDISKYERFIQSASAKFNVPVFLDKRKTLINSPVAKLVLSALTAAVNYDSESIFAMLKTGLMPFSEEEIAMLEDYVYIWEIDKSAWFKKWNMNPQGFVSNRQNKRNDIEDDSLETLNILRQKILKALKPLNSSLSGGCEEISRAVYKTLIYIEADKALKKYCDELNVKNDFENSEFVMESWDSVMQVLDSMVRCYKDTPVSADEYIQMLRLSFSEQTIGAIPYMLDEVCCGSADRIRPARPKYVFVIGLVQGEFPAEINDSGLLLKSDRLKLERAGLPIADRFFRFITDENYLIYFSLCCASDGAFAFCHTANPNGNTCEESAVFSAVCAEFKNSKISVSTDRLPESEAEGFEMLALNYYKSDELTATLKHYYNSIPEYRSKISVIEGLHSNTENRLSADTAKKLCNGDIFLSASRIETYNKCAFSYFCRYVLNVKKLQKAELDALQRGTVVHFVLEQVLGELGADIALSDESTIKSKICESLENYLKTIQGYDYLNQPRFMFLYNEISKMLFYILRHISREFANSDFSPQAFELNISDDSEIPSLRLEFSPGRNAVISGQIDRVDRLETHNGSVFIRVVDYKTGKKSFYLPDVLTGLNMQMLVYSYALKKSGDGKFSSAENAGILYMPSNRGMLNEKGDDPLVMNGMLLENDDVIAAMDKKNLGCFVPKKSGRSRMENPIISKEDFDTVFSYVDYAVRRTAEKISKGLFDICPKCSNDTAACKYCDFADVCKIEPGDIKQNSKRLSNEETLSEMRKVVQNGD